jgi:hypothetical protein
LRSEPDGRASALLGDFLFAFPNGQTVFGIGQRKLEAVSGLASITGLDGKLNDLAGQGEVRRARGFDVRFEIVFLLEALSHRVFGFAAQTKGGRGQCLAALKHGDADFFGKQVGINLLAGVIHDPADGQYGGRSGHAVERAGGSSSLVIVLAA